MAKALENARIYGDLISGVWVAPVGTPLPTDLSEPPAPWDEIGWIDEDGLTQERKIDSETLMAWQAGTVVRKRVTSTDNTFAFKALEEKLSVFGLYFTGATAAAEGALTRVTIPAGTGVDQRAFVVDAVDGNIYKRYLIETGEVTDRGEIPHKNDELTVYEMTVTVYGDFDMLTNNPAMAPAGAAAAGV